MSINNYENFGPVKAAQFVACTDAGYIIGDAILNEEEVEFGEDVTITWGEEGGGTGKPTVEPHVQTEIRAVISKTALG